MTDKNPDSQFHMCYSKCKQDNTKNSWSRCQLLGTSWLVIHRSMTVSHCHAHINIKSFPSL